MINNPILTLIFALLIIMLIIIAIPFCVFYDLMCYAVGKRRKRYSQETKEEFK